MGKIYGYCRISTAKQKIDRQVENIRRTAPDAVLFREEYTGTTTDRPTWNRLRAELDELRRELSTEREHSRATSEKLAQLTDQAQQLQAAQIQRASAPLPIESADDQTEDTRPSLWARIFGKK